MLSLKLQFHSALHNVTLNSFVLLDCNFTGGFFWASKSVEEGKKGSAVLCFSCLSCVLHKNSWAFSGPER